MILAPLFSALVVASVLLGGCTDTPEDKDEIKARLIVDAHEAVRVACLIHAVGGPVIVVVVGAIEPASAPFLIAGGAVETAVCARLDATPVAMPVVALGSLPPLEVLAR